MGVVARLAALLIFTLVSSSAPGQQKPRIFVGAPSKTLGYGPLRVAAKKVFFEIV